MHYSYQLSARLDPSATLLQTITAAVRAKPKRVVFAEGEDEAVIRAAIRVPEFRPGQGLAGGPRRCGAPGLRSISAWTRTPLEIRVPLSSQEASPYIERLYKRIQRRGALHRDAARMVTNDRNIYAASMLAAGDADAMVTGVTRNYAAALADVRTVIDDSHGTRPIGMQVVFAKGRIVLVADTSITELPNSEQLADIAIRAAATARKLGLTPRVAMLASSTFGFPRSERSERIIEAVHILDVRGVDFEYDGEIRAGCGAGPRQAGSLSLRPPDRHGQCADHAGDAFGADFDQAVAAAGRRQCDGPACWSAWKSRCRSRRLAPR